MFGIDRDPEGDMIRVYRMITELAEQLAHNKQLVAALQSQAGALKGQAIHNETGYALRRFNVDISQEVFESELERTNAQIIIENQTLQHENKQLGMLLKEYEQTLDTVMSKFRNHALAAQQHELTLTRHYETLLISRESNTLNSELSNATQVSESLQRLLQNLRKLLRSLHGEDPEVLSENDDEPLEELGGFLVDEDREDWALERECEITRLGKENEELRKLLGIDSANAEKLGLNDVLDERQPTIHSLRSATSRAHLSENWRPKSPQQSPQPFGAAPAPVPGNAGVQSAQTIPLQRTVELQPGMRAAGTLRRSSIFGQRGRGNGANILWGPPSNQDRWRELNNPGNGGGLDLAG